MRTWLKAPKARQNEKPLLDAMARASMAGMCEATAGAKEEMRDDVLAAGLGHGLSKTVRSEVYPNNGSISMSPAGIVYAEGGRPSARSGAKILGHYNRGSAITPALMDSLAIPTKHVPRGGRGNPRLTPREVEGKLGIRLNPVRLPSGNLGLFARIGKRKKSRLMFVLVREVPGSKRLEFKAIVKRWGGRIGSLISANFEFRG